MGSRTTATGGIHQKYLGLTDFTGGWSKVYGGTGNDLATGNILQTSDGGYIFSGYTGSYGAGGLDAWLIKTDAVGTMEWNITYGGPLEDAFADMIKTRDGGYVLGGYTASFGAGNYDFWLIKVNATGAMQWSQTYGGTGSDQGFSVFQTSDGGYALTGSTNSSGAGNFDYWLVKTDAAGTMQWNKTYGGTGGEGGNAMVQTSDGGYAIFSMTASFGAGGTDAWLVKTDAAGTMQWNKTYGGTGAETAIYLIQTSEGGYALCGSETSFGAGGEDVYIIKTDAAGNKMWNQTYGGPNNAIGYSMIQTSEGGYAIVGGTRSFGAGSSTNLDCYLIKTDSEFGLAQIDSTANSITLYRGATDPYWNFVRVRIWKIP